KLWLKNTGDALIAGLCTSPDGKRLAAGTHFMYPHNGGYRVWELGEWEAPNRQKTLHGVTECYCRAVAFIPPGEQLVCAESMGNRMTGRRRSRTARLNIITMTGRSARLLTTPYLDVQ